MLALEEYLARIATARWQPGVLDCSIFMADWVREKTGVDPIADVRGSYSSERQFLKIVRREGGFLEACNARLTAVGLRPALIPAKGNIVAVLAPYAIRRGQIQSRPTGAIALRSDFFAVVTSDLGLVHAGADRLPLLKTWKFTNG